MWIFLGMVLALFVVVLLFVEAGWRIRARARAADMAGRDAGLSAIDGAVFGLMGLLIAFTFSGAAERFEVRRTLIAREANDIGTTYLRLDLLPPEAQPSLRMDLRSYTDARIEQYQQLAKDPSAARTALERSKTLQMRIWTEAMAATAKQNSPAVTTLVVEAMNEMFDVMTLRAVALETHPPFAVYIALGLLVFASSLLAGYAMAGSGQRNRTHTLVYAATLAFAMYLILDMEYPRFGLVRIDAADRVLKQQRESMR